MFAFAFAFAFEFEFVFEFALVYAAVRRTRLTILDFFIFNMRGILGVIK